MKAKKRTYRKGIFIAGAIIAFAVFGLTWGGLRYYLQYLSPGWHQDKEGVYYRVSRENRYARGIEEIDGELYCFGDDKYLLYGWISFDENVYFADEKTGVLVRGICELEGRERHFHKKTGTLLRGWQQEDEGLRYYLADGTMETGYQKIGQSWYYFNDDGVMQTGWQSIDDGICYFDETGIRLTGNQVIDGKQYHLNEDGVLLRGWVTEGKDTCYYSEYGEKLTGTQKIDGETYYLTSDGRLLRGWVIQDGRTYYYSPYGQMLTGWQTIGEKRYYFDEKGIMAVNTRIGTYEIGSDGTASKMPADADNLDAYLDEILDSCGRTPEKIHHAVCSMIKYKGTREDTMEKLACEAINTRKGACWNYASLGYLLLKRAGYEVYYIRGIYTPRGNVHCWLYVHFEDGWYYMDCMHDDRVKLTEEQFAAKKFTWDKSGLPENTQEE